MHQIFNSIPLKNMSTKFDGGRLTRVQAPSNNQTNFLWASFQRWLESEINDRVETAVERAVKSFIPSESIEEDIKLIPSDACDYLHISLPTLHRLFNDGKLHRIKVGRGTRVSKAEIDKAIANGTLSNRKSK